jgi:predicted MFS family arabinose efflux permease
MTTNASRSAEWRRGWPVVASSAIGIGTGAALYQYVSSLFIAPLQGDFGWSRGQISLLGATALVGAFTAPLIGRLADRYGVRPVAIAATITIALAFAGLAAQDGSIAIALAFMILFGLAVPGTTGVVYSRAVSGWFRADKGGGRGLALGVMSSGISIAALIATPIIAAIIAVHGYRGGYLALAAAALFIGLPAILIGLREPARAAVEPVHAAPDESPAGLFRTRRFWLLVAIMFLVNVPSTGILTQLAPLLTGKGFSTGTAAALMAAYAASVLVGRIGIGWLFDRLPAPRVAFAVTFIAALGCTTFHSATPVAFVYAGVVTVGLMQGAETDVLAYFVGRMFPLKHFSAVYGGVVTASLFGTATGIVGFGALHDATQSYDLALMIAAVMLMTVAALYLLTAKPMREANA